jgi:NAD(P)-dependent dehydrogenase (short-subunit alcohol dehydrogenase family)
VRKAESTKTLKDRVAVVAGASRGCGRGLALALADEGATVYVTARSVRGGDPPVDGAPGTIDDTAEEVTRRGGLGIPVRVDYTAADQVEALFKRVKSEHGRLDVVCSAVWGGNERYTDPAWKKPFWEQPAGVWDECINPGPRAFWLAARAAAAVMAQQRSGLLVAITEPSIDGAFESQHASLSQTLWGLAHASINSLVKELSRESRKAGIIVVGLLPGFMRTERVEMHLKRLGEQARKSMRYDLSETTEYAGRAVAALAKDRQAKKLSGQLHYVADLAAKYGFTDADGKRVGNFYRELGLVP